MERTWVFDLLTRSVSNWATPYCQDPISWSCNVERYTLTSRLGNIRVVP
jgi:hypothetical protein